MIKTGLGRRIALLFVRSIGKNSLGPGLESYASAIDFATGKIMPPERAPVEGMMVANNMSVPIKE